jgi:GNAT superfamily N-acetyltransferase
MAGVSVGWDTGLSLGRAGRAGSLKASAGRPCRPPGTTAYSTAVSGVEVRPIRQQELEELLPLIGLYQRFYGAEPEAARNRWFFSRFLHPSEEGLLLGAWANGDLVGFATLYWFHSSVKAADTVLMNDLFVREDVRGGGVGRALIKAALGETRRRGAGHLEWYTAPHNLAARRLYDSLPGAKRSTWYAYEIAPQD